MYVYIGPMERLTGNNDIVEYIEADKTNEGMWKYEEILKHQGPLRSTHKNYKGSSYNVRI